MPGIETGDTGMETVYSYQVSLRLTEIFESCELRIRSGATSGLCDVHVMFRVVDLSYIYMLFS
jgi:hypothetical protein